MKRIDFENLVEFTDAEVNFLSVILKHVKRALQLKDSGVYADEYPLELTFKEQEMCDLEDIIEVLDSL